VDGGSRGNLFDPFDGVSSELLTVLRFEPDPSAEIIRSKGEIIFDRGLWSERAQITLNLAKNPATSSVYPPNEPLLKNFNDRIGLPPRATAKVLQITVVSVDDAVAEAHIPNVDFIKLDIHGAEYEAVLGATKSLNSTCVGLLVEAWTIEVHKGQKLVFDVEALGADRAMKLAICADLYRHTGYALQLFDHMGAVGYLSGSDVKLVLDYITSKNRVTTIDKVLTALVYKLQNILDRRL